jgi:hypothetical protein
MNADNENFVMALRAMVAASHGVLGAASFGDHANIRNAGYVCLGLSSAELVGLRAAADMGETFLKRLDEE